MPNWLFQLVNFLIAWHIDHLLTTTTTISASGAARERPLRTTHAQLTTTSPGPSIAQRSVKDEQTAAGESPQHGQVPYSSVIWVCISVKLISTWSSVDVTSTLMWLLRATAARRVSFESLRKLRSCVTRVMAFSTEERGSPNDFDYKIYFSKCCRSVPERVNVVWVSPD